MHHLGIPARKDVTLEEGTDVVETIMRWGENKISELEMRGIKRSRVILDPGVGFGKTPQQSLVIIQNAHTFKSLGIPVYIGHSRKSFIRLLADDYEKEKDRLTLELSLEMSANGIDYLRVHDVKAHAEMFLESE
jgi:dihydropteroate synthase